MGCSAPHSGWRVSQVESLLNMRKRDITRSCYGDRKRGDAGILKPADARGAAAITASKISPGFTW